MWHLNTEKWGLHSVSNGNGMASAARLHNNQLNSSGNFTWCTCINSGTPPEKRQTILQHFCTNQTSARVEQNTGKQMDFIAIIYWDKTCCHPEFTRSNQIEATLMAGEKIYIFVSCTSTWAPKVPTTFSDRDSCWKRKRKFRWELISFDQVCFKVKRWTEFVT